MQQFLFQYATILIPLCNNSYSIMQQLLFYYSIIQKLLFNYAIIAIPLCNKRYSITFLYLIIISSSDDAGWSGPYWSPTAALQRIFQA